MRKYKINKLLVQKQTEILMKKLHNKYDLVSY